MIKRRNQASKKITQIIDSMRLFRDNICSSCNNEKLEKIEQLIKNLKAELKIVSSNKNNRRAKAIEEIDKIIAVLCEVDFNLSDYEVSELYRVEKLLNKIIIIYKAAGLSLSKTKQQKQKIKKRKVYFHETQNMFHEDGSEWVYLKLL